jgi:MarR family transcriptional regulator, organic hydroperoxide resistance regulator
MSGARSGPSRDRAANLGARLRRLSERIDREVAGIYAAQGIVFEQRWFGVLDQVSRNGPLSGGEVAAALRISHVSVSQAVRSLEISGLIQARPDKADARRKLLSLTPPGERFVTDLAPLWRAFDEAATELNDEAGDVVNYLDRLEAALEAKSLQDRIDDSAR